MSFVIEVEAEKPVLNLVVNDTFFHKNITSLKIESIKIISVSIIDQEGYGNVHKD